MVMVVVVVVKVISSTRKVSHIICAALTVDSQLNPFTREIDEVDKRYDSDNLDGSLRMLVKNKYNSTL